MNRYQALSRRNTSYVDIQTSKKSKHPSVRAQLAREDEYNAYRTLTVRCAETHRQDYQNQHRICRLASYVATQGSVKQGSKEERKNALIRNSRVRFERSVDVRWKHRQAQACPTSGPGHPYPYLLEILDICLLRRVSDQDCYVRVPCRSWAGSTTR